MTKMWVHYICMLLILDGIWMQNGDEANISRSTRKPAVWTLLNVSTKVSLPSPRMLIRSDTFRLRGIDYRVMMPETENLQEAKRVCPG